jgi:hypothetical protein
MKNTKLTGTITEIGSDPETGNPRVIVETTEEAIRSLEVNPFGKRCTVELVKAEHAEREE